MIFQHCWTKACTNDNIYKVVGDSRSEIAIFTFLTFLDENVQTSQYLQGFRRQSLRNSNIYFDFLPQPWLLGSKLWLRGKGNLGVETLILAGSVLAFRLGPVLALKNSNIYKVFRMLDSETSKNLIKN